MDITLLGTGDTTGTPKIGCDCDTCAYAQTTGISRTRFSVHVYNGHTDESLLVDFSPDFRQQFLEQDVPLPDAGLVTHIHFDHLDGLGNAYRLLGRPHEGESFPVYAANETDPETGESVVETVARRYDYLDILDPTGLTPYDTTQICGLNVTMVPVTHPPLLCYGVRIEDPQTGGTLSITGDTSYAIPEDSKEEFANPDLLLADGIVPPDSCKYHPLGGDHHDEDGVPRTFGTKHMTKRGALDMAEELKADEMRIVHVGHRYPREEAFEQPLAIDGEQFSV